MFPAHFARLAARSRRGFQALILALAAFSAACAPGETPVAPSANPLLEPFVGTWDATVLTIRSVADTSIVVDLLENGVSYISIYESGNYLRGDTLHGVRSDGGKRRRRNAATQQC